MTDHYIDSLLGEREKIILIARQHWFKLFRNIILEIFLIILFFILTIIAVSQLSDNFRYLSFAILVGFVLMSFLFLRWSEISFTGQITNTLSQTAGYSRLKVIKNVTDSA
jgi:hypothetical protein